ncbi:hypothetical protein Syun_014653 [Stephania yunnanensis]|uniref:Reverse transcriptase domain-containing protein n=1 Tax=Stephania yunnanensis TaxID=152371 RepID=A0AAP0P8R5_9MAGN
MPPLIKHSQSSFVAGRHIFDNILIAQELIHSLKNIKERMGWMAMKIDPEKAYETS